MRAIRYGIYRVFVKQKLPVNLSGQCDNNRGTGKRRISKHISSYHEPQLALSLSRPVRRNLYMSDICHMIQQLLHGKVTAQESGATTEAVNEAVQ
jgi:hypothetical protein